MTLDECISLLEKHADSSTRKLYLNGGAKPPVFKVKMIESRKIVQ